MKKVIKYNKAELAWIERYCQLPRREAHRLFCERFGRNDVSFNNYTALCKRKGWKTGRTGRYEQGRKPENKGKKMPYNANSARTRFKKGNLPHNTKYEGHERVSRDGYIELNIGRKTRHNQHGFYILKHLYLWEQKNGTLPEGMCLKCLNGNKHNTEPANWEAIPRSMLPHLNGRWDGRNYDKMPNELKPAILAMAKVRHKLGMVKKKNGIKASL